MKINVIKRYITAVILGAGTVIDPETTSLYINLGAEFIVSPILNLKISLLCNKRKISYILGCMTPTEISTAQEGGSDLIKLFSAKVVGYWRLKKSHF